MWIFVSGTKYRNDRMGKNLAITVCVVTHFDERNIKAAFYPNGERLRRSEVMSNLSVIEYETQVSRQAMQVGRQYTY